jgi:molybdopterin/thiamine biosynthesis adenylyltransferase
MLGSLRAELWHPQLESAAILLCVPVKLRDSDDWRLIIRETYVAPDSAYEERTAVSVTLSPSFGLPLEKKARQNGWSIVYCHTHPHQHGPARFSEFDAAAEIPLAAYASSRSPGVPHVALLFAYDQAAARRLGSSEAVRIIEIGSTVNVLYDPRSASDLAERFNRQVRAFGEFGQRLLGHTRVAIVGLGGTGSVVAQQLAYLGVSDYVLVDRDNLDATNLNRTVGASTSDVSVAKVSLAKRMIRSIQPDARVLGLNQDVVDEGVGRRVASADIIFCCTDSQASRHLLNQISYQYLVPMIDLGVAIDVRDQVQFAGHVKALSPGLACLWCIGNLDSHQVRLENLNPEQRHADPYFIDQSGQPQPSVISLNSTMGSLAVTMFLAMIAGVPSPPRYLIYDGNRGRVSSVIATADPNCNFCSPGSTALGADAYPVPERRRVTS